MLRSEKTGFVNNLQHLYGDVVSLVITHYQGLTVAEMTRLRKELRAQDVGFKVIKNTLAKIAAHNSGLEALEPLFVGPVAVAYAKDELRAAKHIFEFARKNEKLKIIGGVVNKNLLTKSQIETLAVLPSLGELRATLLNVFNAPATKLVRTLSEPAAQFLRVVHAYSEKPV